MSGSNDVARPSLGPAAQIGNAVTDAKGARGRKWQFDPVMGAAAVACLLFLGVQIFPIGWGLALGLFNTGPFSATSDFVGLDNFKEVLSDPDFWRALLRGCIVAAGCVSIQVVVGVIISVLIYRHAGSVTRSFIILPLMIPAVTGALAWRWITNDVYGIVNHVLLSSGLIHTGLDLANSPVLALPFVIAVSVWQFTPFVVLIMLANLGTIPQATYEAARIDGATGFTEFFYITLPLLKSSIMLIILLRTVWMFNRFDIIWLLTEGGPRGATTTLPLYAYLQAFGENDYGAAGAVSAIIFLILLVFGTAYLTIFKPEQQVVRA
jgi:multiple sugar transport system permease protein